MSEFSLKQIFLKNTSYQMIAQGISLVVGLITNAVLSRYLGIEGFGQFSYVFAFFYLFLAVNDLGIHTIVIREISQHKEKTGEVLGSILVLKILLAAISLVASWIAIEVMGFSGEVKKALWVYSLLLPILALQLPLVVMHVALRMDFIASIGVFNRLFQFSLLMLAVWKGWGLPALIAACLISEFVAMILMWIYSKKTERFTLSFRWVWWKKVITPSLVLGLASIFAALINRIDFLMLERMASMTQVGLYSAAYRITNLIEALPLMVMVTAYPLMSRYAQEDIPQLTRLYKKLSLYLTILAIPIGVIIAYLSPWIVKLIFGAAFTEAARGLAILVWSSVFFYFAIVGGNVLISLGKEKVSLGVQGFAVVVNLVLNMFWIPKWGFLGAALATCAAFFCIAVLTRIAADRALKQLETAA